MIIKAKTAESAIKKDFWKPIKTKWPNQVVKFCDVQVKLIKMIK
jgi:hypothetical protein